MRISLILVYHQLTVCIGTLLLVLGISEVLYAQSPTPIPGEVAGLQFEPIPGNDSLYMAKDVQGDTWIKGNIPPAMQGIPIVFQIPSSQFVTYDLYVDQGEGFVRIHQDINHAKQKVQGRYPLYFFNSQAAAYYLRTKDRSIRGLDVAVYRPSQFIKEESVNLVRNSLYYGLAMMSIILNFVLYLIFRDRGFILYSLLQLSLLLIFCYQDGMFYFLSQGRFFMQHYLIWNIAVCATLAGLFAYYFLDLKHNMPQFKRLAKPLICCIFGSVLFYTLTEHMFFRYLASVFFYTFPVICLYQAFRMFRRDVYARFLLLSFGIVALISVFYTLNKYFSLPFLSYFDINVIRLANILEIIGISFALVFKVKAVQDENEMYKERLNRHLHELEHLKKIQHTIWKNGNGAGQVPDLQEEVIAELKAQYDLTDREVDVLLCIWKKLTNQEINERLHISINTTKYHIRRLYLKLAVNSREEVHQVIQSTFAE